MSWIGGISMLKKTRGIRKIPINLPWYWQKSFQYLFMHQKDNPHKPLTKVKRTMEEMWIN
jgi:hypothetical protein